MKSYIEKNWQSWIEKIVIECVCVHNFKLYTPGKLTENVTFEQRFEG